MEALEASGLRVAKLITALLSRPDAKSHYLYHNLLQKVPKILKTFREHPEGQQRTMDWTTYRVFGRQQDHRDV